MRHKVILDCDPGHDGALAILLAAGDPRCELLGITTVAGNHVLDQVTRNAGAVCAVAGIDVPIARGAARPLVREPIVAPGYPSGSTPDGPLLPEPQREPDSRSAPQFIVDTVLAHAPGAVSLVPTGPLTNVALALALEPALAGHLRQICLMGGTYTRGNRTPAAEFNILVDPEAADAVLSAPCPVTMVGLDLTYQVRADDGVRGRIRSIDGPVPRFVEELLAYVAAGNGELGNPVPAVHDLCAVAAVVAPEIMTYREAFVAVELTGRWTTGMTVTDFDGRFGREANTSVAVSLDRDALWAMLIGAVERLGRAS
ncbi:nucleoside hydrolase [Georgenia sunbinii]|uniref:nucleoside hydrolase n=1 Tax=Georgenia sunbinii TaxID=3117728 RepID=UPI002F260C3E